VLLEPPEQRLELRADRAVPVGGAVAARVLERLLDALLDVALDVRAVLVGGRPVAQLGRLHVLHLVGLLEAAAAAEEGAPVARVVEVPVDQVGLVVRLDVRPRAFSPAFVDGVVPRYPNRLRSVARSIDTALGLLKIVSVMTGEQS